MARINTNISSLIAQQNLSRANDDLNVRLQRLATGVRLNRGADDPAGLIAAERLRSELSGIEQGIKNSERASSVIATAEGSLNEVSELLSSIRALVVEAANTGAISPEEIEANQLQIDSAIESITRISNTSSFAGLKLLDGSLGYRLSGVDSTDISKAKVFGAAFLDRSTIDVDVEVVGSAQQGALYMRSNWASSGGTDGILPSSVTLRIAGRNGVNVLTFTSGSSIDSVINAINDRSSVTGVEAARVSAGDISSGFVINSVDYGSESFVSVEKLSGGSGYTFYKLVNDTPGPIDWTMGATFTAGDSDSGKDVLALVNGALANGRGLEVRLRGSDLSLSLVLSEAFATTVNGTPSSFDITGGGALYQLGPSVTFNQQTNIGIDSISASSLGGTLIDDGTGPVLQFLESLRSGGLNDLKSQNFSSAGAILESAIDEISTSRGRLGAFERNTLDTNIRSLQAALENITSSVSVIRDTDFAKETSELTRGQILVQAGTSVLATSNTSAQSVLQLLG